MPYGESLQLPLLSRNSTNVMCCSVAPNASHPTNCLFPMSYAPAVPSLGHSRGPDRPGRCHGGRPHRGAGPAACVLAPAQQAQARQFQFQLRLRVEFRRRKQGNSAMTRGLAKL